MQSELETRNSESWGELLYSLVHEEREWREVAGEIVRVTQDSYLVEQKITHTYYHMGGDGRVDLHSFKADAQSIFAEKVLELGYERDNPASYYEGRTCSFAKNAAREALRFYVDDQDNALPADFMDQLVDDETDTPNNQLEERSIALRDCLDTLRDDQRQIAWFIVVMGMSRAEAGRMFKPERSRQSVKRSLGRALKSLTDCIPNRLSS